MQRIEAMIVEWSNACDALDTLKGQEMALRAEIFAALFPSPTEGVNTGATPSGVVVKGTHKINRALDVREWERLQAQVPPDVRVVLVSYKPTLNVSAWKDLTPSQRLFLANVVNEKPGLPTLEIKAAK